MEDTPISNVRDTASPTRGSHLPDVSRFIVFIIGSIIIAFMMVLVSMDLYQKSGAAQLDLSRPSYEDVRSQAEPVQVGEFSSSGPIDKKSLDKFQQLYDDTAKEIMQKKHSFSPDAMSDKTLGIKVH